MGNSLRCCLACVLPCGALDVVRVVHLDGQVEEYGRPVSAGEILAANPDHIIRKPCSRPGGAALSAVSIVSPESDLKRGHIYFLIPESVFHKKRHRQVGGDAVDEECVQQGVTEEKVRRGRRCRRRRSGRVGIWKPHLESIEED
ncbi:hypothetical protein Cni_G13560 [Canna indica]|uniref:Uncharacterized protein n=1 Tax=Canna indica TaxID=4628 RepID=A0AAQ3KCU1_9LILI|nr:hypothetical protein Cni_G13560 [Canna indica]